VDHSVDLNELKTQIRACKSVHIETNKIVHIFERLLKPSLTPTTSDTECKFCYNEKGALSFKLTKNDKICYDICLFCIKPLIRALWFSYRDRYSEYFITIQRFDTISDIKRIITSLFFLTLKSDEINDDSF